ncbi:hypothetical protein F2Q69_00036958 [Brassica cretica]|uniref:uDENN domain-containing protein n=1 Tax=Brassica cretica TaxID=69181 RepID=A0A8S9STW5_BRACR|nr:hypothetical protein F2Q69_00036958 [Brassica cretica]
MISAHASGKSQVALIDEQVFSCFGFHGLDTNYLPSLLDQFPPSDHSLYPPPPPQLPTCVLPAGVAFHSSWFVSSDPVSFPRSYPIVLTGM